VQRRRKEREGERPVPHYWEHVLWVWGFSHDGTDGDEHHLDAFLDFARAGGPLPEARAANLHARGVRDRAHRPGPPAYVSTLIADWVADTFAELKRS